MEAVVAERTIGNPVSLVSQALGGAASHVGTSIEHLGGEADLRPDDITLHELTNEDLREALQAGMADLGASRSDAIFIVLVYPVIGIVLAAMAFNMNLVPLLFPVAAGFALLGPLAAVGLYEISRRREAGLDAGWGAALSVLGAPNFGAVVVLGLYLLGLFVAWMTAAYAIYLATLGPEPPASIGAFASDLLGTGAGWTMILVGCGVGFLFALTVLAISVVSFPLILDRKVGVATAVVTSVRLTQKNPRVILTWGFIVAAGLVIGSIPAFRRADHRSSGPGATRPGISYRRARHGLRHCLGDWTVSPRPSGRSCPHGRPRGGDGRTPRRPAGIPGP